MANSFKLMSRSGVIKRSDTGMFIRKCDIYVREKFNKREDDERTQKANEDLFKFLMNGGSVPPLEVVPRDDGGVWVVEGHRRNLCYGRCEEAGKPVEWIQIIPFVGNDVQRLARIMTSNNQLALSPVEQAGVVQELAATFNLSTAEISRLVHKSIPTVEKLLTLSIANHDVQQAVKSGAVSVEVAVDRVKEHGENAGNVLAQDQAKAAAAGKKKVTRSVITPQISTTKARRAVSIAATAKPLTVDGEDGLFITGAAMLELQELINEHLALKGGDQ